MASFISFVDTYTPNIIFGTESWLSPSWYSIVKFSHTITMYTERTGMMVLVVFSWHVVIGILAEKSQ